MAKVTKTKAVVKRLTGADSREESKFGTSDLRAFGRELRRLREGRGFSLKRLSDECGVSVAAIQKLEAGAANPSFLTALRLSEALDRPLSEIVDDARNASPERLFTKGEVRSGPSGMVALHDLRDAALSPMLVTIAGGEVVAKLNLALPVFVYVLEGNVAVTFADKQTERLQSHDALHLSELSVTKIANMHARRATLLCISDNRGGKHEGYERLAS